MDATELRDLFRAEFFDVAEPYLVSDLQVYAYIDEAQKMFCRFTEGIEDGRSFTIAVKPGAIWYPLDPRILKVRKLTDTVSGREIEIVSMENAEQRGIRMDSRAGPLMAMISGIEKGNLRAWPVPNAAGTLSMSTFRLPTTVATGDEFEIDEQHHPALLMWVKHKAYGIHDTEIYDKGRSDDYELRFRRYCSAAKAEQGRARHSAGNVAYGGII